MPEISVRKIRGKGGRKRTGMEESSDLDAKMVTRRHAIKDLRPSTIGGGTADTVIGGGGGVCRPPHRRYKTLSHSPSDNASFTFARADFVSQGQPKEKEILTGPIQTSKKEGRSSS